MRIGIDIDDTMTFIKDDFINEAIKYDISLGNNGEYKNDNYFIAQRFNWTKEQYTYYMEVIRRKIVNNAKLRLGLKETLKKLKQEGHKIIIISARSDYYYKNAYKMSKEWLDKEEIPYDKLIVNALNKAKPCKEEKIDIFIDDSITHCLEVNELGIKVYIMDNIDNYLDNPEIERIYDFNELYNKIKNIKE